MFGQSTFFPSGKKSTVWSYEHKQDSYVCEETENSMLDEESLGHDYNSLEVIVFIFRLVYADFFNNDNHTICSDIH
jgi:hypothetical protein